MPGCGEVIEAKDAQLAAAGAALEAAEARFAELSESSWPPAKDDSSPAQAEAARNEPSTIDGARSASDRADGEVAG